MWVMASKWGIGESGTKGEEGIGGCRASAISGIGSFFLGIGIK